MPTATTTALAPVPPPVFRRQMRANVGPIIPLTVQQAKLRDLYLERFRATANLGRVAFPRSALDLTGEDLTIRAAYREMLGDPFVKSGIFAKVLSVISQDLSLTPTEPDSDASTQQAEMLTYGLTKADGGFVNLAWAIVVGALLDGKSLCEWTLAPVERGKWRGKVRVGAFKDKAPNTYHLICDDYLNVVQIESSFGINRRRYFDPREDGFVLYQHARIYQNPHGMSDLRAAHRGWSKLQTIGRLRMIGLDKFTGPFIVGSTPEDKQAALAAAIAQARADGYLVMDNQTEIDVKDLMTRGTRDFADAERDAQQEILIGIMGAYLQQLEGTTTNGRGNARVAKDVSELFQWHLSVALCVVLREQVLPKLTEVNYGPDVEPPEPVLGAINVEYLIQQMQVDQGLKLLGWVHSMKDLASRYQRPFPKDENDRAPQVAAAALPPPAGAPGPLGFAADPRALPQGAQPAQLPPAPGSPATPFRRLARSGRWAAYAAGAGR